MVALTLLPSLFDTAWVLVFVLFCFVLPCTQHNSRAGCLRLVAAGAVGLCEMTAGGL